MTTHRVGVLVLLLGCVQPSFTQDQSLPWVFDEVESVPAITLPQWPETADDSCNWTAWDACAESFVPGTTPVDPIDVPYKLDNVCQHCDKLAVRNGQKCGVTHAVVSFVSPQISFTVKPQLYQRSSRIAALINLDTYAAECKLQLFITSHWRPFGKKVKGAIVEAAKRSRHMVGQAIDLNFKFQRTGEWCKESNGCLSSTAHWLNKKNNKYHQHWSKKKMDCPDPICKCFADKIRADADWRWGGDFRTPDMVHVASNAAVLDDEMRQVQRSIDNKCYGSYTKVGKAVAPPKTSPVTYTPAPTVPDPNATSCMTKKTRRQRQRQRQRRVADECVDVAHTGFFTTEAGARREMTCAELSQTGLCYDDLVGDDVKQKCPQSCGTLWACGGNNNSYDYSMVECGPDVDHLNPHNLPSSCYNPTPKSCDFYDDCLDTAKACGAKGYARAYGKIYCERFAKSDVIARFNQVGKTWVEKTMTCIQQNIADSGAMDDTSITCDAIKYHAFGTAHPTCYVANNFCEMISPKISDNKNNLLALRDVFAASDLLTVEADKQMCDAVLKCVDAEWFTLQDISTTYTQACGAVSNPDDDFVTYSIFPSNAKVTEMTSALSPAWGAYSANEYVDPYTNANNVAPMINGGSITDVNIPRRIIGEKLAVADFMSKHIYNGKNHAQAMVTTTHPITNEALKLNKFFRLDTRIVECAHRLQTHVGDGFTIAIIDSYRTRSEAYSKWQHEPTTESFPTRLQTGAAIRYEVRQGGGLSATAAEYLTHARNAVLECYPIFAEFGKAIGIGLGPEFIQIDMRERTTATNTATSDSQGYRAWVYPGAVIDAATWDAEVYALIRSTPIYQPTSGTAPPERVSAEFERARPEQHRLHRRRTFEETQQQRRQQRQRRGGRSEETLGGDDGDGEANNDNNNTTNTDDNITTTTDDDNSNHDNHTNLVRVVLTEQDTASEQKFGRVYTYDPHVFDLNERKTAALHMLTAMSDVHDEALDSLSRSRRAECRDAAFTGLMYATDQGLHKNELTCSELNDADMCTTGDLQEQVQSLCPKTCGLCGTGDEVKKSFCWRAIYAGPGMSEAYGDLYSLLSAEYASGKYDDIPHKPWVKVPAGTGGNSVALFDARVERDDVENAMFQCFFSCDPVGNWFEQIFARLKDLLGSEDFESVMKRKERHCDNFIHWVAPDVSNWGELNNTVHLASLGNDQMQENARFWGQALDEVPLYNIIVPFFMKTFVDLDGEVQQIHDDTHNPTPIFKVFDQLYAMMATGKVTVWVQHAVELRAMRKTFEILVGYNDQATEIEVRVPNDAMPEAQLALNDLIEGFQDSLWKTKRKLLTPVTWKALGDISRKGSHIYGAYSNSTST